MTVSWWVLALVAASAWRAPTASGLAVRWHHARSPPVVRRTVLSPRMSSSEDPEVRRRQNELAVWKSRQDFAQGVYRWAQEAQLRNREAEEQRKADLAAEGLDEDGDSVKSAFVASALAVVAGATILRLGGRTALMSVLGLDIVADMGIKDQVDQFIDLSNQLGPLSLVGFFAAWIVAKVFLVDFIAIGLAISAGVLYGGAIQGALLSATAATVGSLVGFYLSRTTLQESVAEKVGRQPTARALARVVERDAFKTVFVLRLAPVLPLPIGAYNYIYGSASNISAAVFAPATFLGSLKPYLLDAYIGVYSKSMLDGDSMDGTKEALILVAVGVLTLVGFFATDLASKSWDEVQAEVKEDEKAREAAGEEAVGDDFDIFGLGQMFAGPIGVVTDTGMYKDSVAAWEQLEGFLDVQWDTAGKQLAENLAEVGDRQPGDALTPPSQQGGPGQLVYDSLFTSPIEAVKAADPADELAKQRARMAAWVAGATLTRAAAVNLLFMLALLARLRARLDDESPVYLPAKAADSTPADESGSARPPSSS